MRAGAAIAVVDVPAGTAMAGYAARTGGSTGTADPVTARALVLDGVAIVALDLCAVHPTTGAEIRRRLTGVVTEALVCATHTHAGPCAAFERLGPHDATTHERVLSAAETAVRGAVASAVEGTLELVEAVGTGVAHHRRHPTRGIDPAVQALRVRDAAGNVRAHLVQYPCHPVVLDAANTLVSADFPGALRERVEAAYPGSVCVYVTGAAGDVNPGRHPAAASFTTAAAPGRTLGDAHRVGRRLADAVLGAPARAVAHRPARVRSAAVDLPFEAVPPERRAADLERWSRERVDADPGLRALLDLWTGWARRADPVPATYRVRVSVVDVGVLLVLLPGEPFLASAERIAARLGGDVLVVGYTDDVPGYLPPAEEYAHGGYEVLDAHRYYGMPAPFAPGSAEMLEDAAVRVARSLR